MGNHGKPLKVLNRDDMSAMNFEKATNTQGSIRKAKPLGYSIMCMCAYIHICACHYKCVCMCVYIYNIHMRVCVYIYSSQGFELVQLCLLIKQPL